MHLANRFQEAKGRKFDELHGAFCQTLGELIDVPGFQGLVEEGLHSGDHIAAQHNGASQNVHLAEDFVHLVQRL